MLFTPRPSQDTILQYTGGTMGISAVPGSGKTFTLSALAAQLIAQGRLDSEQEVLIVTLVNSAVDNFSSRIGGFIRESGLLPHIGYRVRTLHGLAHDIVREKPGLVGLEDRFGIIDERESAFIRKEAVKAWLHTNAHELNGFLDPEMDDNKADWVRRQQLPDLVESIALAFIRSAKDRRLSVPALRTVLDGSPAPLPLAEMGWQIYSDYQRALAYRGAVDFDDLIRLALDLLEADTDYLERLRYRWPYILEDEAQDSSQLQEQILRLLAGPGGNWVRVGDPNQAIFETFTTANPRYLIEFIRDEAGFSHDLPESGRSQPSIIALANTLVDWVMASHPVEAVRGALVAPPHIQPTAAGDPQANPVDDPGSIHLIGRKYTPDEEVSAVAESLARWLPEHPESTAAVLVPRNARGVDVINELKKRNLDPVELLSSTNSTRAAAGVLGNVAAYLSDPQSASKLSRVYQVWRRELRDNKDEQNQLYRHTASLVRKAVNVEDFLFPGPGKDWLDSLAETEDDAILDELSAFRETVNRWQGTTLLPIDQMILTLSQDLFTDPADLALAHKLALVLRQAANEHPEWRLPELTGELGVIARNERRFLGFSSDDSGFDPQRYKGRVVVTTMHKAKGLEWDRVYLMSVNNYDFPSDQPNDSYIAEKWFVRDQLNLEAETLAQLETALGGDEYEWYAEGQATQNARRDYVRERLRLFYVGITRAKRELIVTWNTGRNGDQTQSLPFAALQAWWSAYNEG